MATQSEKLAQSLDVLDGLCKEGKTAIRSKDLSRTHRERLLAAGFLKEVMKGWYICTRPDQTGGESTAWFISYWGFCADYLNTRLGDSWCLSPEQSLLLQAGNRTIPRQLVVRSRSGSNNIVSFPHGTTLLSVRSPAPERADQVELDGLRVYAIAAALTAVAPDFFQRHQTEARVALARITSASEVLPSLLERGQTTIAGRLAGAFRNMQRTRVSDDIVKAMATAGHPIRVSDPFTSVSEAPLSPDAAPPHVHRLRLMWADMRSAVIAHFPPEPTANLDIPAYRHSVEERYVSDAYHSLSIEGYQISRELIERVRTGDWAPEDNESDRSQRDAMVAKGYWQAFQRVQMSLNRVLSGENPGVVADEDHGDWYRALFAPAVTVGLMKPADLAGYRNGSVFIRQSRHVPPRCEAVRDLMPAFFQLLAHEEAAAVRVVLGHFVLVNIHPYMDGNGRIGRFLMNIMLASGGYPWVVIPVERRDAYMSSLERASIEGDIIPFTEFIAALLTNNT